MTEAERTVYEIVARSAHQIAPTNGKEAVSDNAPDATDQVVPAPEEHMESNRYGEISAFVTSRRPSRSISTASGSSGRLAWRESGSIRAPACRLAFRIGRDRGRASHRVSARPKRTHPLIARPWLPRSRVRPVPIVPFLAAEASGCARRRHRQGFSRAGIAVNGRLLPNTAPLRLATLHTDLFRPGRAGLESSSNGNRLGCIDLQPR